MKWISTRLETIVLGAFVAFVDVHVIPMDGTRLATNQTVHRWSGQEAPRGGSGDRQEFGTIAAGRRADLLLVEGNPLDDVARLRRPAGVMTRGRWLTRDRLEQMLTTDAQNR